MTARNANECVIFTGICPDEKCRTKLYFPFVDDHVVCNQCGQKHKKESLENLEEVTDIESVFRSVLRGMLINALPKRGTEAVKVLGLSNYHCKLLSPLLTRYGMDKETGKAKLLSEMNQGDIFDCGLFGDRAFLIDPEHVSIPGFGRDVSGGMKYLQSVLKIIKECNDNEERLIPIHSDGDGHCLVHAISRALVGRELFWHPLRCSLKKHLEENLPSYKDVFKEFVDESDWKTIIEECDPEFLPPEGELLGLRNIHVFGLANVLKRPIILLDSIEYMDKTGDYAALFLPTMIDSDLCKGKDGRLNKPLCIAWSSVGHNHYIPLVGKKKSSLPVLPKDLLPKAWGVPQSQVACYIEFNENGCCTIGGDRSLGDPYILRLVAAMEELFCQKYKVHPILVADSHHYLYASTGDLSVRPSVVITNTEKAVKDSRLYRCLTCNALNEQVLLPEWFKRTGLLYNMALRSHGVLNPNQMYAFPARGIFCVYDPVRDELVPDLKMSCLEKCACCEGSVLRKVNSDGSVLYRNRDRTKTPADGSLCKCGFKHYWEGKEYDNLPQELTVNLEWNGKVVKHHVAWFQNESDPSRNSNAFDVASVAVQKHFPGEFGSERLSQRVVSQILEQTKPPENKHVGDLTASPSPSKVSKDGCSPSKIIIGGTGILHKEELGVSSTEQKILHRIETRSSRQQKRQALTLSDSVDKSPPVELAKASVPDSSQHLAPKPAESTKFLKVATSDGRQGKLDLGEGITFETLQQWISDNFQIAPENQKIKHGFPLQELLASSEDSESFLSLSPGQRIVVEVVQTSKPHRDNFDTGLCSNLMFGKTDWDRVVDSLTKNDQDPVDAAVMSFQLAATLAGLSPWEYAQKLPHLFECNGIFYRQMKRDVGLGDGKHGWLPVFPGKVFVYNSSCDRLELCVEPYGHHRIVEAVEEKILKHITEAKGISCCPEGSNYCVSGNVKKNTERVPFQGTGYTLKDSDTKSPKKETKTDGEFKVPFNPPPAVRVRKGPGVSVLSVSSEAKIPGLDRLEGLAHEVEKNVLPLQERSKGMSSSSVLPSEVHHKDLSVASFSRVAVKAGTSNEKNSTENNIPKNDVSEGSLHSTKVSPDLPEPKSGPINDNSPSQGDYLDHPMEDCTRDCENMDLVVGKDEGSSYLHNSVLERNLEMPDETQAMDVDSIAT